jgi:DNA-binding NarL/FixJ family response regulator
VGDNQEEEHVRLVLADDDPRLRKLVRDTLSSEYDVVGEASSGEEVIDLVSRMEADGDAPDVVVLDYVMPGHDGVEAARALRELDPSLPIVVFSSLFDRVLTSEVESLGLHYVEKAAGVEALELAVSAAVALPPT